MTYKHVLLTIYDLLPNEKPVFGNTEGICCITGKQGVGVKFEDWVPDTFTDYAYLKKGDIICNEAAFFFAQKNEYLQKMLRKGVVQTVRNYSVIVHNDTVHFCTKADKKKMYELICNGAEIVCLAESGQKHILFKHRIGFWQLENVNNIVPNVNTLQTLMQAGQTLLSLGFTQTECITGQYRYKLQHTHEFETWQQAEKTLAQYRGTMYFKMFAFLLHGADKD